LLDFLRSAATGDPSSFLATHPLVANTQVEPRKRGRNGGIGLEHYVSRAIDAGHQMDDETSVRSTKAPGSRASTSYSPSTCRPWGEPAVRGELKAHQPAHYLL